ncbi:hypothetical protein L1887_18860 [Cichorium endivia]|nr:hypothetical protein L1887_18860 [Cichorium endivia]
MPICATREMISRFSPTLSRTPRRAPVHGPRRDDVQIGPRLSLVPRGTGQLHRVYFAEGRADSSPGSQGDGHWVSA